MSWPSGEDYCEAVQNLRAVAGDEELRAGQPKCDASGYPLVWHGGFANVYRIDCPSGNTCAMKCFTCDVADRQRRYREIAAHLKCVQLPFTVDFEYLQRGLRIRGEWFPVVKMQWVEGARSTVSSRNRSTTRRRSGNCWAYGPSWPANFARTRSRMPTFSTATCC